MGECEDKDGLSVPLGGILVQCDSADDAEAVAKAAAILDRTDRAHYPPAEIERLTGILSRYGHARAARLLKRRSVYG
jgi:hypothetical protein